MKLPIKTVDVIEAYIESVTDERVPDGMYHPSGMFLCDRQVIYGVRGETVTNPPDIGSKRKFYIGHRLHEVVQRAFESAPGVKNFYPEFEVNDPVLNIAGHGDGLIEFDDGTFVVLEVKSIMSYAVKYGLPKEEHKNQVKTYAYTAREVGVYVKDDVAGEIFIPPLGDKLIGVLIVYVEKSDLKIYDYFLEYEADWGEELLDKLDVLDAYRHDPDSLPKRLPLKGDGKMQWPCNYCPFKDKCWNTDPPFVPVKEIF